VAERALGGECELSHCGMRVVGSWWRSIHVAGSSPLGLGAERNWTVRFRCNSLKPPLTS
jgi:hypothetical protein